MKAQQLQWSSDSGWTSQSKAIVDPQAVLLFGSRATLEEGTALASLRKVFPSTTIVGGSTGGQILADSVTDEIATALALRFERTAVQFAFDEIEQNSESFVVGARIGAKLAGPNLRSMLVFCDGLRVNGSKLIHGLRSVVGDRVVITGGLAGDGANFARTLVVTGEGGVGEGRIATVGLYGTSVLVGHGSAGGWTEFGPKRTITRSAGNVLAELDGKPALELYKSYLGPESEGLPGTALLYPLLVRDPANASHAIVRTVLSVDHEISTMTFAGDVPEGWSAQLMRGYFDRLAEGAEQAARAAMIKPDGAGSDVAAVLVSCIGRRLLMGESIIDEITAAHAGLGPIAAHVGFYSYGEISPHQATGFCELHNQTMTVTTISEAA